MRQELIEKLVEMAKQGYDAESVSNELAKILGNPEAYETILDLLVDTELDAEGFVDSMLNVLSTQPAE